MSTVEWQLGTDLKEVGGCLKRDDCLASICLAQSNSHHCDGMYIL